MALSANRDLLFKLRTDPIGDSVELLVAASTKIYQGAFVGLKADGYVRGLLAVAVGTTLTGGDRFVGVAAHPVDNSAGADGAKKIKLHISGAFDHAVSGLTIEDVGAPVFASADDTLTKVALGNPFVGWVERFISAGVGTIRMAGPNTGGVNPEFIRVSPTIVATAANKALLIHATENQNGLLITEAFALVTTVMAGGTQDQGIITLQDTDGTTLGVTFTPSDAGADAVDDKVEGVGSARQAATGVAMVVVPAGKGVQAVVTQLCSGTSAAGAMKVFVKAFPIA